jgi:hypothetical protein
MAPRESGIVDMQVAVRAATDQVVALRIQQKLARGLIRRVNRQARGHRRPPLS